VTAGRALVAVLCGRAPADRYSVHRGYVDALWAVGAQPVLVPAGEGADCQQTLELVERCDALILSGGTDVDPVRYGRKRGGGEEAPDPERDEIEIAALRSAITAGRPALGICRGIQVMAVADGGTLFADLPAAGFSGHSDEARQHEPVHDIEAGPGSAALASLGGATRVNSIHHQAVATTGTTMRASAWSPDGLIEAVEAPGLLGIQWHPERLAHVDSRHLAPFRWLVSL
jgi:putative glutamine amidotransferase